MSPAVLYWDKTTGSEVDHSLPSRTEVQNEWSYNLLPSIRRHGEQSGVLSLQVGRTLVRFPMISLEIFIDIILPAALWPCGRLSL